MGEAEATPLHLKSLSISLYEREISFFIDGKREFKRGEAPLRRKTNPLPAGGRVGRHPMRIYSHWDMGRGIGQGEGHD
jgi:hypothetical protein